MSEIKEVGTDVDSFLFYMWKFSYLFISEILSVASGTCRCSMGGRCPVLSWISRQTLPERNQCFCSFVLHQFPQGIWLLLLHILATIEYIVMELIVGPCEFRMLKLMGARSKTFKRGPGHHTTLFENEKYRYRLVLDTSLRLLPLSDHSLQRNCHWLSKLANWSFTSIPLFEVMVCPSKLRCRRIPKAYSPSKVFPSIQN